MNSRRWLWTILVLALVLRILCWPSGLVGGDSIGYAIGGLGTWIAHPPGYFGYCFLGWLVNQAIANINDSLILINVVGSLCGIWFAHGLAESFGLTPRNALLATAAYAFSINLDYFSVIAGSYALEGMMATWFALLCRKSIQDRSFRRVVLATIVWAVSGAFRQTSFAFLAPLWLFTVWRSGTIRWLPLYLFVAMPIVYGWSFGNRHYLAGASGNFESASAQSVWRFQALMTTSYDATRLGLDHNASDRAVSTYHWPFVEGLYWIDGKFRMGWLPRYEDVALSPPDLKHAARLSGVQLGKYVFYLLFSVPSLLMLLMFVPLSRRWKSCFESGDLPFFAAWILPVSSFFVVGHLGVFGYLQIFLSGICILVLVVLQGAFKPARFSTHPASWSRWQVTHVSLTMAALAFFLMARPYQSSDSRQQLLDVLVFQYTATAIQNGYFVSRGNLSSAGDGEPYPWRKLRTDAEIVRWYESQPQFSRSHHKPHTVR